MRAIGERREGDDGFRHYVDGRGVHAGDILELARDGHWKLVRYEGSGRNDTPVFLLDEEEKPDGSVDDTWVEVRPAMLVRWPVVP